MHVAFQRTGTRRYAVIVTRAGAAARAMDPAPGYDDDIPHDLVHYVVEAELGLTNGVYGRAARRAGTFIATSQRDSSPRERARHQRKQQKRERALSAQDAQNGNEMARSERLAALSDLSWRRQHGQTPEPGRPAPSLRSEDATDVARVVARLNVLAPLWRALRVDQALVFEWPHLLPSQRNSLDDGS
jgi:hypothetical protein